MLNAIILHLVFLLFKFMYFDLLLIKSTVNTTLLHLYITKRDNDLQKSIFFVHHEII